MPVLRPIIMQCPLYFTRRRTQTCISIVSSIHTYITHSWKRQPCCWLALSKGRQKSRGQHSYEYPGYLLQVVFFINLQLFYQFWILTMQLRIIKNPNYTHWSAKAMIHIIGMLFNSSDLGQGHCQLSDVLCWNLISPHPPVKVVPPTDVLWATGLDCTGGIKRLDVVCNQ